MHYLITAVDFSGNESAPASAGTVTAAPIPQPRSALLQNSPNPFNPTTTIRFDVGSPGHVTLRIYDVGGRLVRTLVDRHLSGATHFVAWDGRDDAGLPAASGVYFYRLKTGEFIGWPYLRLQYKSS